MDLFTWGGGGYATWCGISHSQQPHCCCANSPDISAHPTVCARVLPLNTVATSSGAIWGEWFQSSNFATSQKWFVGSLYHGFPDVSGKTKANNFANLLTTGFREQFAEWIKGTSTSPLKIPNTTNEFLTKKSSRFLVIYHSIRI